MNTSGIAYFYTISSNAGCKIHVNAAWDTRILPNSDLDLSDNDMGIVPSKSSFSPSFIKPRNALEPSNISYNKRFVFQNKIGFCDIGMVKIVKNSKTDSGWLNLKLLFFGHTYSILVLTTLRVPEEIFL